MNCKLSVVNKKATIARTSVHFDKDMSYAEWRAYGYELVHMHDATLFWIGDWVNHGKSAYGEKYKIALEVLPYAYQSLVNIAFVCAHMPVLRRRVDLTWTHHREVMSLPAKKQATFLKEAATKKWSVAQLRAAVRMDSSQYGRERAAEAGGSRFNIMRWTQEGIRWLQRETRAQPVASWPLERRRLLKRDLQPLIAVYEQL
jgi:hypothetical protein